MKPYRGAHQPEDNEVFNYRLSRARRISENAFGVMAQRWRLYQRRVKLAPDTVDKVIIGTDQEHSTLVAWLNTAPY